MTEPITISELTRELKALVESEFKFIYVIAEISNFKRHTPSGHCYFILKDETSQINATLWSFRYNYLNFKPQDGDKVLVKGKVTLYEPRGTYQIDVTDMQKTGLGELQAAFEKLKDKLQEEGLFETERKRKLPEFPQRVGIVTSETGAVIEDFKNVTRKRYPIVEVLLFPALVQGAGSADSVCRAIRQANKAEYNLDIIVVARGGGSMEDLWTFNEEKVAREVFNSKVPVVSAIGHEPDFTICDFVADLRAPTPSAAAELIFPEKQELLERINQIDYYIKIYVKDKIDMLHQQLDNVEKSYSFNKPIDMLNEFKMRTDDIQKDIEKIAKEKLFRIKDSLLNKEKLLNSISPEQTLKRGFTYVIKNGKLISRKVKVKEGEEITVRFYDGDVKSSVVES
jgi:exodeoxyribonuclease VII large subunit